MKNETALGHVLTLMTIIIWGTTFVSTKVLLEAFTPIEILFFRFTLGYLSLWAIYPRKGTYGTLRQELLFAAAGLCGVTLYFLLENIALTYTLASNVGVLVTVAPFFTALLSCFYLRGERPDLRFYAGFVLALAGVTLIMFSGSMTLKLNPAGDIIGTATAGVNGEFTATLVPPQINGEKLAANATDAAGNTGENANVTAPDTTAPDAPTGVTVAGDGGSVSGHAEAGSTITIKNSNGIAIGLSLIHISEPTRP